VIAILALAACLTAEPGAPDSCSTCHGSSESSAPPSALGGATDPTFRGVGAHEAHLLNPGLSAPVACGECHLVPDAIDAPGHLDSLWPAEVSWEQAAIRPNASEPFDVGAQSCVVYCHGSTLTGGTNTAPVWTVPFAGAVCDDCHGFPPPPPHPVSEACSDCHPSPLDGEIEQHVDGELQVFR
jgi:predicted CxxxxCH...CXXCH cytochrome family protein